MIDLDDSRIVRKPIAVAAMDVSSEVIVICNDGAVYVNDIESSNHREWEEMQPIPGTKRALERQLGHG